MIIGQKRNLNMEILFKLSKRTTGQSLWQLITDWSERYRRRLSERHAKGEIPIVF